MPECKNDPSRKYKGDEPSPKGLGYCAHAEEEGVKKKGKDGNYWIVKKLDNGSKRWIKDEYQKIKAKFKGYKKYMTLWNGGRPYLCYIKDKDIHIFKKDPQKNIKKLKEKPFNRGYLYTKFVKYYNCEKIFIGKDTGTKPGSDMFGCDKKYCLKESIGNSILLKLKNNRYIYIGEQINEFSTKENINNYYSIIGPNAVPYPVALGKENIYFMLDNFYISRDYFPELKKDKDFEDAYGSLYKLKKEEINEIKTNFQNYKEID